MVGAVWDGSVWVGPGVNLDLQGVGAVWAWSVVPALVAAFEAPLAEVSGTGQALAVTGL